MAGVDPRAPKLDIRVLREGFRYLRLWESFYAETGIDVLRASDGTTLCLWDLLWLYDRLGELAPRQAEAIELFLVQDIPEDQAAVMMGTTVTNPVGTYATDGLRRLLQMHRDRIS